MACSTPNQMNERGNIIALAAVTSNAAPPITAT